MDIVIFDRIKVNFFELLNQVMITKLITMPSPGPSMDF